MFNEQVLEEARTLVQNRGETALIRNDEFIRELLIQLIKWGQKYECQMKLDADMYPFYLVKVL